jgi:hypothetical protein
VVCLALGEGAAGGVHLSAGQLLPPSLHSVHTQKIWMELHKRYSI